MNSRKRSGSIAQYSWSLIFLLPLIHCQETFCPPPVSSFLKINSRRYTAMKEKVVYMNEVIEEQVARLSLKKNPYYSSPKCSVLETDNSNGYKYFGVREEYDAKTFTRKEECQVYLARTGFGKESLHLTVLVIAEVIPGMSTECQVQMSTRASFNVKFCAEEWSCAEEKDEDEEDDIGGVDSDESCAEEWGCIGNDDAETEKEEESIDSDNGSNCSGEWGCFDTDLDNVDKTEDDKVEPESVENESEFVPKSLVGGVVPEARVVNTTNTTTHKGEQNILDQLIKTLMSENMAPLTLSMLILLGITLLLGMWCLCFRGTCSSSRKHKRRDSMSSSLSRDTKIIIGTLQREKNNLSRNSSMRSSMKSYNSNVYDDDLVMYFGDEDDKDYNAEEIVVSGKRKLFTVSEEIDPTEEGLESLEWDINKKPDNKSVPIYQKSHCQNVDHSHLHNDFPSFYI
eukprot:GFUD01006073.1.p1 GENE.GFUD01006073.1~~GFUD01006073.1.p1  ORF type:complete len:455 (-),score=111.17 GFUD01006073.1:68-1432(-)